MIKLLTLTQKSFFERMVASEEERTWGFEILSKRNDFYEYFDVLLKYNLFSPEHNPGPVPVEEPGSFVIPYWPALNYLEAIAERAEATDDSELSEKVMEVIRSVSRYRDSSGSKRDNYHTNYKFAEILGKLPTTVITNDDLGLIPDWISSKYGSGLAVRALDVGVLNNLLNSRLPDDWSKACLILDYCTEIRWVNMERGGIGKVKPVAVSGEYWLIKLINHHSRKFGITAGKEASNIFCDRIKNIFSNDLSDYPTYLKRPAVEDHPQNLKWEKTINCMVEGLRDVLLAWVDNQPVEAIVFVGELIENNNEMLQRIGIHVLNERWRSLSTIYNLNTISIFFKSVYLHETYRLLMDRFTDFNDSQIINTLKTIKEIKLAKGEEPEKVRRRTQRKWLSAIVDKGHAEADKWFYELDSDRSLGPLTRHPDFVSYMFTWDGPPPSPITTPQLIYLAKEDRLIQYLNDYEDPGDWRGSTIRGLVKTLEKSIQIDPQVFISKLPDFLTAKRPYQYGLINGFKQLWDKTKEDLPEIDWNIAWSNLLEFFEKLIGNDAFWEKEVAPSADLTPTQDWITSIIAAFLKEGTRSDDHAYDPALLPLAFPLIKILLEKSEGVDSVESDAMTQAINSSKGIAIEALLNHTLRACRVSDQTNGNHDSVWQELKPIFDNELAKCTNGNFDFSTLSAAYIANIQYLDANWMEINFKKIFSLEYELNFMCAVDGLSYASNTSRIYELLVEFGVIERALKLGSVREHARTRLIERVMIAYLWGIESIDSERISYLFSEDRIEDLQEATYFLTGLIFQDLKIEQITLILHFWRKCVNWATSLGNPPKAFLSNLSQFICYFKNISQEDLGLFCTVAGYMNIGHNTESFFEHLDRLVGQNPREVSQILSNVLDVYQPNYDYGQHLSNIIKKLIEAGLNVNILGYADRLIKIPEIYNLIKNI